jgi:hypothetical protein
MAQLMTELTSPQPGQETRSAVERIAAFAAAARPEQLAPDIRQLFKRNILDSIGCAIAALPGPPFRALRLPPSASNNPPESKRYGTGTVQHTGPVFWSSDSSEKKSCGSSVSIPKVVILGGGDAGVQD